MISENFSNTRNRLLEEIYGKKPTGTQIKAVQKFEEIIGVPFKEKLITRITWVFIASNAFMWVALIAIYLNENYFLFHGKIQAPDRIIDWKIVSGLITATVTQASVCFAYMIKNIFPNKSADKISINESNLSKNTP